MIRLVLFLLFLAALAFGGAWLADRPGEITVVWQGYRVETSVPVALAAMAVVTAIMLVIYRLLSLLLRSPRLIAAFSNRRRREKGWGAVTRGLLAIGTGDGAAARQARAEAARYLPHEPLTHLLAAQTAQFEGNRDVAIAHFKTMAEKSSTRLLGLRGLHMEARRAGETSAASAFAEEAAASAPTLAWAAEAVIEARCAQGDFAGARDILERQMAQKGIDKTQYRRCRAVLLAAEAIALENTDPPVARERAIEAVRLAPTLVPAAACAGRLLGAAGELKKAAKIVETAFAANPHPELADVEAYLRPGDAALDRLKRIRTLAAKAPSHPESAIALAHAALDAQEFGFVRLVLEPLVAEPSQRVCLLMAELEAAEHGDIGKAREWTARAVRATRDPAWIADGVVSDRWAPISPISGKLDAFVWAVPPGVSATPILEHDAERVKLAIAAVRASEDAKAAAIAQANALEQAADAAPLESATAKAAQELESPSQDQPGRGGALMTAGGPPATTQNGPGANRSPVDGSRGDGVTGQEVTGQEVKSQEGLIAKVNGTQPNAPGGAEQPRGESAKSEAAKSEEFEAEGVKTEALRLEAPKPEAGAAGLFFRDAVPRDAAKSDPASSDASPRDVARTAGSGSDGAARPSTGSDGTAAAGGSTASGEERPKRLPPPGPSSMAAASASPTAPSTTSLPTPPLPVANDRQRPSRAEPIVAMPPLPDDPGPDPDEPQPEGRRSRFLGL